MVMQKVIMALLNAVLILTEAVEKGMIPKIRYMLFN